MAINKKDKFTEDEQWMADVAKALGHPARISIMRTLMNGRCCCGDVVHELPLAQATVSQHLKALKEAGLVNADENGVKVEYSINAESCNKVNKFFGQFFYEIKKCCC